MSLMKIIRNPRFIDSMQMLTVFTFAVGGGTGGYLMGDLFISTDRISYLSRNPRKSYQKPLVLGTIQILLCGGCAMLGGGMGALMIQIYPISLGIGAATCTGYFMGDTLTKAGESVKNDGDRV